jgi:uncharacterized protein (DUF2141 family)
MYSGDNNYVASQSKNCEEPLCVRAAPSTTVTLLSASTIVLGNTVYDTATVTGLGGLFPVPTGTVTFMVSFNEGPWMTYDANVTLVNGTATSVLYTPLAAGNYEFMAVYSGDVNYKCSASAEDSELLAVTPALGQTGPNVTTALGVSSIMMSQSVSDNATVTGLGFPFPVPTGTVTFQVQYNEGSWMIYDANVTLVNGTATSVFYMPTAAGLYEFQAVYSGDSNYLPSVSAEDSEPLNVTMGVSTTSTSLSAGQITFGESVTDMASVSGMVGFPVPTGSVDFQVSFNNGTWMTFDANVTLVNGTAISTEYTPMAAGHYEFRAIYSGSASYLGSMSPVGAEPLCVKKAPSQTTTDLGVAGVIPEPVLV